MHQSLQQWHLSGIKTSSYKQDGTLQLKIHQVKCKCLDLCSTSLRHHNNEDNTMLSGLHRIKWLKPGPTVSIGNKNNGATDGSQQTPHVLPQRTSIIKGSSCSVSGYWRWSETHVADGDQSEPWGLALAGVPLMALKMPMESDRVLLEPSSTGLICKKGGTGWNEYMHMCMEWYFLQWCRVKKNYLTIFKAV